MVPRPQMQIVLIILAAWFGLSLLALPLFVRMGRAGHQADRDALRQHAELADVVHALPEPASREPLRAVR